MKTPSVVIGAGQTIEFFGGGSYFHLLTATGPISVTLKKNEAVIAQADGVNYGYKALPKEGYTGFTIYSATAQTLQIAVGDGDEDYNYITGAVQLIGQQGAFTQGRVSLTNVNQAILAANAARKYLMVQNNDAAAVMRVQLSGVAATAAQGFRVQPGGFLELIGYIASGSINVIMETATGAAGNCEYVEG